MLQVYVILHWMCTIPQLSWPARHCNLCPSSPECAAGNLCLEPAAVEHSWQRGQHRLLQLFWRERDQEPEWGSACHHRRLQDTAYLAVCHLGRLGELPWPAGKRQLAALLKVVLCNA